MSPLTAVCLGLLEIGKDNVEAVKRLLTNILFISSLTHARTIHLTRRLIERSVLQMSVAANISCSNPKLAAEHGRQLLPEVR